MNLLQFVLILRAHYKVALAVAIVVIVAMMGVTALLPKQYTASTSVYVDTKSADPIATMFAPVSLGTQIDIIQSQRVSGKVVRMLGLDENKDVREQWLKSTDGKGAQGTWLAERMLRGLRVTPGRESNVLQISYTGAEPAFSAEVVNAFAQAYIDVTIELKVDPARKYARWFNEQGKSLRDNVAAAQAKLSAFQQDKGLVANDERLDTETAKLSELSSQLIKVQAETSDARSKQQSGTAGDAVPEVTGSSVVTGLRSEIAKQEAKLQEAGINLGVNHPQYLRMQSEIVSLKQKLEAEMRLVTSGFSVSRTIGIQKEADLKAAITAQRNKLLQMKNERDQLAVLQRDVESAKGAYDMVSKRLTETTLTSQSTEATVAVLSPAIVPLAPSFPKSLDKMLLMAIGLGMALGIAAALGIEALDRRVRSTDDLATIPFPVLGVIGRVREPWRLAFWRGGAAPAAK